MTTVVPAQASSSASSVTPRTWSFVNCRDGRPVTVTCMSGCTLDHSHEMATPTVPENVFCWTAPERVTLPVNSDGEPEELKVLSTVLAVEPFSPRLADRVPHAVVELVDDHFVDGLDPDGLATVISTLATRLDQMRETHARLVRVREEYRQRAIAS